MRGACGACASRCARSFFSLKFLQIAQFNRADHDTTLTNVAAGRGVCLAPGFLNDHSGQFAWIPFDCREHFSCVLCTHREDTRPSLTAFLDILTKLYRDAVAFPL